METLRKTETYTRFADYREMENLLDVIDKSDKWLNVNMASMKVGYIMPGTSPQYIYNGATQEQVDAAYKSGTFTIRIEGENYLVNPTTELTIGQTTETCCRLLSKFIKCERYEDAADLYNKGLSFLKKDTRVLVRGDQVMAMFSKNYCVLNQKLLFDRTHELIMKRFPSAKFVTGSYTHEETCAYYDLCDHQNQIFQKYKDAWSKSGFDEEELKAAKVYIRVATGDTGEFTYKITPYIVTRTWIPLGEPEKVKHYGKNTVDDIDDLVGIIFSNLESGLNRLADMMDIDIPQPIACVDALVKKIGLDKICPSIIVMLKNSIELLEVMRSCDPKNRITAFTIYQTLLDAQYYPAFKKLESKTQLKAWESFYKASVIDWNKLI